MTEARPSAARTALRRYPALGYLALAALLATLLPSALTLPQSGPAGSAELAPVAPEGESADQGAISELGSASSGGLGFGAGPGTAGEGGTTTTVPGGRSPLAQRGGLTLKRCVGSPPRQAEDPLSPPCVGFFDGDNGGATARGVTGEEIRVVVHWGPSSSPRLVDYDEPITGEESANDLAGKVYARYFTDRYQLYGRRLHLYGYYGHSVADDRVAAVQADLLDIVEVDPFALVPLDSNSSSRLALDGTRRGLFAATYRGLSRSDYRSVAPRLVSYSPSVEDSVEIAADYACRRLVGRPPRYAGPDVVAGERQLGLLYNDHPEDPTHAEFARALRAEISRRCGHGVEEAAITSPGSDAWDDYPAALASLRTRGVTTVVPITKSGDPLVYLPAASAQGWHPEWFFPRQPGAGADDTPSARVLDQGQWANAFGVSFDVRRPTPTQQPWAVAFLDACPDCPLPTGFLPERAYATLSLLAYGVQAAGPRLTVENVDKGLHAIAERPSPDPYVPAAYFRPGEYAFVKDAKEMWWDPSGIAPGAEEPGCYRLPRDGVRVRVGEWPAGDDGIKGAGQPCQGQAQL